MLVFVSHGVGVLGIRSLQSTNVEQVDSKASTADKVMAQDVFG